MLTNAQNIQSDFEDFFDANSAFVKSFKASVGVDATNINIYDNAYQASSFDDPRVWTDQS